MKGGRGRLQDKMGRYLFLVYGRRSNLGGKRASANKRERERERGGRAFSRRIMGDEAILAANEELCCNEEVSRRDDCQ